MAGVATGPKDLAFEINFLLSLCYADLSNCV
jgi:hypothetical protein